MKEEGTKAAADIYYAHLLFYPYQMYINWEPEDVGNLLYNDKKFVTLLYQMNGDYFTEYSKVSDAGSYIKGSIYEFIGSSEKVVVVVDCENSDPYKLCATLKNLDYQYTQKIASIILFDDVHSASAWRILDSFTHFHYRQPAQGKTSGIFLQINLLHRRFSGLAQLQFQHIKRRERLRKTYLKLRCVK